MGIKEFLSIGKVAKLLGVTPQTIRRWQKEGKIQETRSPTDRRLYSVREVNRIMGVRTQEQVVIYARVSSAKQKADDNLERQVQRLKQYAQDHGYEVTRVFQEQASGINENRKQLHQLLQLAEQHEIQRVLIELPDRLARFGFSYLTAYVQAFGSEIIVIDQEEKDEQQELVEDLIAIITSFSARIYGKRGGKKLVDAVQTVLQTEGESS